MAESSGKYEAMPRLGHVSAEVGRKVLVYSGVTQDYSEKGRGRMASIFDVFDPQSELWETRQTTGEPPASGVRGAASATIGGDLFTYGGTDARGHFMASLHRLDIKTHQWHKLSPRNAKGECPMAKFGAGMVAFGDDLALFAGYGLPHGPTQPGSSFIKDDPDGSGWTNEFHIYHINGDMWSSPTTTGERPPPCFAFSLTSIGYRRAVMFGGDGEQGTMNEVYIIDLQTMIWTKLNKTGQGPWPEERAYHAACCLNYDQKHPQLLVTGGESKEGSVLGDAWMLDVDSGKWRKMTDLAQARCSHSTTAISVSPGLTEITMFGGSSMTSGETLQEEPKLADTTLLQFRHKRGFWELCDVVNPTELGQSEKRLREKLEALKVSAQIDTQRDSTSSGKEKVSPRKSISYKIDLTDLEFGDLLGTGGFGTVFRGKWKSKRFDVALKKVNITPDASDAKIMSELGEHPNIISFYGFAYRYPETIIVTALAKKGSLYDLLHVRKEKPTQQQSLTWAQQIAYGMAFMHRLDYVHRDLKSSNVLFSDKMVAQVCDFGTARFLKGTTFASKVAGTPCWMAPEVAQDDAINKQCDVFSFSIIIWELMEHKIPFSDARTDIMASVAIMSGKRPPISASWPDYLSSLTQACWVPAPNDRPTFSDIVTSLENESYFKR